MYNILKMFQFDQTSLGLPSKDYFLNQAYANYLEAYKKYLIKITVLLGAELNKATTDAEELLQFEKELAKVNTQDLLAWMCFESIYSIFHGIFR